MFKSAIKINSKYTRPVLIGERLFQSDKIENGIASFIILNDEGYVLTCRHVAEELLKENELEEKYVSYLNDLSNEKDVSKLNKKYEYDSETVIQIKNVYMNCFEKGNLEKILIHKYCDLAVIKFKDFLGVDTSVFPKFTVKDLEPGESICKLGYPWPNYDFFELVDEKIEIKSNVSFDTQIFPMDGMITRLEKRNNEIIAFEMTTPNLRGASGGPVFDVHGNVLGIQTGTASLDMKIDINTDVVRNNEILKTTEKQFINFGIAISSNIIMQFLDENKIKYEKTSNN